MSGRPRILVRLPNWVGDVCMALPALTLLREGGWQVIAAGRGWAADLLAGEPEIDVLTLPRRFFPAVTALANSGCRDALLLTNSFASALQARCAGLEAYGYAGEGRSPLLGRVIARRPGRHEVETFWRLAVAAASDDPAWNIRRRPRRLPPVPERLGLRLHARHRAQALQALGDCPPYVVLCPLAVGTIAGRSKVWPGFAELCQRLLAEGRTVVACPGPGEAAATAAALPGARLLPDLGLGAYAAVCAGAQVVVANDSGPMHLAAAVDAPLVGLFGVSDPQRTRPWGRRAVTLGSTAGWPDLATVHAALRRAIS